MEPRQPGLQFQRRQPYGRRDIERFDQESAKGLDVCIKSRTIGKVRIECNYGWKRAQWGRLGVDRTPAGIVYIDMTFKQPPGHSLSSAVVTITLSDESMPIYSSRRIRKKPIAPSSLAVDNSVHITQFFGPSYIIGRKIVSSEVSDKALQPTVGFGGIVDLGGVGLNKSVSRDISHAWSFKGVRQTTNDGYGIRSLEWQFTENPLETNPSHNSSFQTAFAFEHSGKPVIMEVEVEGDLKKRRQDAAHKVYRFLTNSKGSDKSMITRIDLSSARDDFQESLDYAASDLDRCMRQLNTEATPMEVSAETHDPVSQTPEDRSTNVLLSGKRSEAMSQENAELRRFLPQPAEDQTALDFGSQGEDAASNNSQETLLNTEEVDDQLATTEKPRWKIFQLRAIMAAAFGWLAMVLADDRQETTIKNRVSR